jgi:hypothetical protein
MADATWRFGNTPLAEWAVPADVAAITSDWRAQPTLRDSERGFEFLDHRVGHGRQRTQ